MNRKTKPSKRQGCWCLRDIGLRQNSQNTIPLPSSCRALSRHHWLRIQKHPNTLLNTQLIAWRWERLHGQCPEASSFGKKRKGTSGTAPRKYTSFCTQQEPYLMNAPCLLFPSPFLLWRRWEGRMCGCHVVTMRKRPMQPQICQPWFWYVELLNQHQQLPFHRWGFVCMKTRPLYISATITWVWVT